MRLRSRPSHPPSLWEGRAARLGEGLYQSFGCVLLWPIYPPRHHDAGEEVYDAFSILSALVIPTIYGKVATKSAMSSINVSGRSR